MSLASIQHETRSAWRARLLGAVDLDRSPAESVTLSTGVFSRAGGSWLADGLAPGQEVTVTGWGAAQIGQVVGVSATTLAVAGINGSGAGVSPRFVAALPKQVAWEGNSYAPQAGRPFVAEVFQRASSRLVSIANAAGRTMEHRFLASVTLHYPAERGTLALERMAGAVMAHFAPGGAWGGPAVIENVNASPLLRDGAWNSIAVSVDLLGFTTD